MLIMIDLHWVDSVGETISVREKARRSIWSIKIVKKF